MKKAVVVFIAAIFVLSCKEGTVGEVNYNYFYADVQDAVASEASEATGAVEITIISTNTLVISKAGEEIVVQGSEAELSKFHAQFWTDPAEQGAGGFYYEIVSVQGMGSAGVRSFPIPAPLVYKYFNLYDDEGNVLLVASGTPQLGAGVELYCEAGEGCCLLISDRKEKVASEPQGESQADAFVEAPDAYESEAESLDVSENEETSAEEAEDVSEEATETAGEALADVPAELPEETTETGETGLVPPPPTMIVYQNEDDIVVSGADGLFEEAVFWTDPGEQDPFLGLFYSLAYVPAAAVGSDYYYPIPAALEYKYITLTSGGAWLYVDAAAEYPLLGSGLEYYCGSSQEEYEQSGCSILITERK